ncbi:hypothetical protein DNTS_014953 [Danionella cerebrum]|uniref:TGF-beta family profile domain-containing protein n=1 Tax=Danionella cerebrum TaxID=2873325 RepID=A0A553R6L1_9TELE|nr:hypothetical protein DNTS_014953 [Danionella translucida]
MVQRDLQCASLLKATYLPPLIFNNRKVVGNTACNHSHQTRKSEDTAGNACTVMRSERLKRSMEQCKCVEDGLQQVFAKRPGEGRWLKTLWDKDLHDAERGDDGEEKEGSGRQIERAVRSPRSAESPCAVHSLLLKVRELGLGYDSDETVLFKYCSGTCPRPSSNHDLTLTNLLQSGVLQYTGQWHHEPCCRPTRHEDIAFLDNNHRWHKVEKLSAAACVCMG